MTSDELLLPGGACLVHVGPPKTGTTALQGALHATRDRLDQYGVVYASAQVRHPMRGFLAAFDLPEMVGQEPPDSEQWNQVVEETVAAADRRVIVSSEFFSDADDQRLRSALDRLGRSRVHIAITARPVIRVLPSAWQQYVRNRLRHGYEDWLDAMFNKRPYREPTPMFWRRYRYDRQIARWVDLVGHENVTVVAAGEGDRELVPRTFESLLGLPRGLLVPVDGVTNRSLTLGEAELIRLLNGEFERRWTDESYARLVRHGVVRQLTKFPPPPGAAKPVTPRWALERAAELDLMTVEAVAAHGVRVVGELSSFGSVPPELLDAADAPPPSVALPAKSVRRAVNGAVRASGAAVPKPEKPARQDAAPKPPEQAQQDAAAGTPAVTTPDPVSKT